MCIRDSINAEYMGKFSIGISSSDLYTLPLNRSHISYLDETAVQFYEIYVNNPGVLRVQVQKCYGSVQFFTANTLKELQSEAYNFRIEDPNAVTLLGDFDVRPGRFYLAVRSDSGIPLGRDYDNSVESIYKIQTQLIKRRNDPVRFVPGKQGILTWEDFRNRTFKLSFNPVEVFDVGYDEAKYFIVDYMAISSKTPKQLESIARCGDFYGEEKTFGKLAKSFVMERPIPCNQNENGVCTTFITFHAHAHSEGTFYGTIRARVFDTRTGDNTFVSYQTIILDITPMEVRMQRDLPYIILLWVIIAILFYALYYMYKKYKKEKQTMSYEIQDARNVAALSKPEQEMTGIKSSA
eukprot:TRINITY_DN2587_c0_g1_i4.p1 TRINITY_DN2587_c0_g1~~TRINITY_DN2587_c0_g1_i4.p1  ORF type:complete len:351 (-),score=97.26 TRINITY_DN2587_c0_g1_i4:79-1131(-)